MVIQELAFCFFFLKHLSDLEVILMLTLEVI